MKMQKRIAYCYPTSHLAHYLADGEGGYYVEQRTMREDGTWSLWGPAFTGDGVFKRKDDIVLSALFAECDGEAQPHGF